MSLKNKSFWGHAEAITYALLRIMAGVLFFFHGAQKILGWFTTSPLPEMFSQKWIGGWLELVGGVLLALGLFVRPTAFLLSGMMAVAYTQFHWQFNFADNAWAPIVNRGELAVLYCFAFLYMFAKGAGIWSLDGRRKGR